MAVGYGIVAPAIPDFALEFGVSRTLAALVVTAFAGMRIVSALFSGRLVDRFGESGVLVTGIALAAVTSGAAGFAQNYPQLLVLRGLGGLGSAMFTVSAVVLLIRTSPPQVRGRANSVFFGGFLVGGIVGPVVGGPLAAISLRLPFFIYGALLVVATLVALVAFRRLPPPVYVPDRSDGAPGPSSIGSMLRIPAYRAAIGASLGIGWLAFGVRFSLIPLFVGEALVLGTEWTGIGLGVFAVANAAALFPSGRWADRVGRKPLMIAGTTSATLGMAILIAPANLTLFLIAMAVSGAGTGMLAVAPAAIVADVAPARSGGAVAFYQMSLDVGAMIGPLAASALVDSGGWGSTSAAGYSTGFALTTAVLAIGVLLSLRMPETRPV
ncbi:MAG: MFS transporter [Actinomycetota bacterium]|nr:MFS transporter [Actinomycetota bacterium]